MPDLTEDQRHAAVAAAAVRHWLASGYDVAEQIAHVLCTVAAAEPDGIDSITRNRPGSWEASHISSLIRGTAGHAGEYLDEFRKDTPHGHDG
jgi:hypothetical protein